MVIIILPFVIAIWFLVCCAAHPAAFDETGSFQAASKKKIIEQTSYRLSRCGDHLEKRGIQACAELSRATLLQTYRRQHYGTGLTSSAYNSRDLNSLESLREIKGLRCVLTPESTIGPFCVRGELIRSNITDGEDEIPLILGGHFIDVNICEPVSDLYWEIWTCNSVGKYSGVLEHVTSPQSNLNKTFLRGLQKVVEDGSAQFVTMFPGHYDGRATHTHVLAHVGAPILPNNTLTGGHIPHISQLFFEQGLIATVEATESYSTNSARITLTQKMASFIQPQVERNMTPLSATLCSATN